ncbi:MAG: tRNA (N(6)-L-threonylcarbamoyladenosine(37)-C(2))-methylthiotransferase MtaB [Lachnospiraceae bacterium]|nr:tRNA (N(6)-L-threonylcarbamoyladenosine(37)-C(2))-methylthiotransferase MtaB [Lachnospiraceae bacterium]
MKTVAFHNLGCKVNAYETDIMLQKFVENGFCVVPFTQKADIYVINTCTVTSIADHKSRQMLHRAKEKNPEAVVIAVGCYVQTDTERVINDPAVDIAIGNNRKSEVVEILKEYLNDREGGKAGGKAPESTALSDVIDINKPCEYEDMSLTETADRTRAYIKIQDGCNQFCSYCLIPYARGRVRSRDMDDIISEIKTISAKGYEEVVLTGIHVSSYGITDPNDLSQNKLSELLCRIQEIDSVKRIRLSSLEPRVVTDSFAKTIGGLDKLCPHFHLSLQSGCDATLKRMNRHYTSAEFAEGVERLRAAFTDPAITTDIIVGFPGETAEEFEDSFSFAERIGFYEMHIFKYSKRKGTVAATLPNQVRDEDKSLRSDRMIELGNRLSADFRKRYLGKVRPVLFEEEKKLKGGRYVIGHTPEYIKVAVPAENDKSIRNQILPVELGGFITDDIMAGKIC